MPEPLIDLNNQSQNDASQSHSDIAARPGDDSGQSKNPATRPDYIPETYWDAEKGTAKLDEFGKAFGELSQFKADTDAKLAGVPEKVEGYTVPESLIDEEVAKLVPPGQDITLDEKSPLLSFAREFAHANKLNNEQFGKMVQGYIKHQILEEKAFGDARAAEREKLGSNAAQREKAIGDFLVGMVGKDDAQNILSSVFSAKQFEAFERLQKKVSDQGNVVPFHQKRDEENNPPAAKPLAERMWPNMASNGKAS
jgi:hypothetical protein